MYQAIEISRTMHSDISLSRICSWFGITRQAYYKHKDRLINDALEEELIMQYVLKIRENHPRMGTRKLHILLEPRLKVHSIHIGRDYLFNLLRSHKLLIKRPRRRYISTTNSNHWMRKYTNLTIGLKLVRTEELWVSDITYLTLPEAAPVYIALITDAFSHKIVGYALEQHMEASMCNDALIMAIENRVKIDEYLIHHSDRGSQYCSALYTDNLKKNNIAISMTESGDPLENPIAERINGIIKNEYLKPLKPRNFMEAKEFVAQVILRYNHERPHASIGYRTPSEVHFLNKNFERKWK